MSGLIIFLVVWEVILTLFYFGFKNAHKTGDTSGVTGYTALFAFALLFGMAFLGLLVLDASLSWPLEIVVAAIFFIPAMFIFYKSLNG